MNKQKLLAKKHQRRHFNIRKRCIGSAERPRLSVFRSNRYIYAQVIDDTNGKTIASCSSLEKGVKEENQGGNKKAAELVGKTLAERAKKAGVEKVSFDRGGFKYHGRIKALADGARSAGLNF